MSTRILVEQLNGDTLEIEVMPEMTMREVKRQLKNMRTWEDELTRDTTVVEVIVGDKKVTNGETIAEVGLSGDSKVTALFKQNVVWCSNGREIPLNAVQEALVVVEIPDSETQIEARAFEGCKRIVNVIIPESVTEIGHDAFMGCSSLINITVPDSVTRIWDGAFSGCSALTSVLIPSSVAVIRDRAFNGCSALTSVGFPDSLTWIGAHAFQHCCSLASVTIPDSVERIANWSFFECMQLTLTAPARLLHQAIGPCHKMMAKECACGDCHWNWFANGWVCPLHHHK